VTGIAIALSTEAAQREQLFALQLRPNHERAVQAALRIKGLHRVSAAVSQMEPLVRSG
jgi:hypothetical protein